MQFILLEKLMASGLMFSFFAWKQESFPRDGEIFSWRFLMHFDECNSSFKRISF
jgi:hypothetical protein